jgi:HAD superfamily hydrolase (TIGR01484 family)
MTFLGLAPRGEDLRNVRYLFTDIDDTLTTEGRLLPQTYQSLWDLSAAGIAIVPVTGGSAGWCEHIVRAWPVAAVIGESGAFAVNKKNGRIAFDYWEGEAVQKERQQRHFNSSVPLLRVDGRRFEIAHDQSFRLADAAIDIVGQPSSEIEALAPAADRL